MEWINAKKRKPEGKIFWALTKGRDEQGICDWEIIRLINDIEGDYRTLDYAQSYRLPGTDDCQSWYDTIYAWVPLEAIAINDNDFKD